MDEAKIKSDLVASRRLKFFCGLTPHQRRFLKDPAKRKAALCSRRAGKTHVVGAGFIADGLKYADDLLYIGLTRLSAKQILWDELIRWNRWMELGIEFNHSELTAYFPKGGRLFIGGADTPRDIERHRGKKLRKAAVDEAGSFGSHIKTLIEEVVSPALMDLDGDLWLTGSPSAPCQGIFHDVTTGALKGWSTHEWTWKDNPYVPQGWFAEEMERRGLTVDDPAVQREYFGKWKRSAGRLMYRYTDENLFDDLPMKADDKAWHYTLGVDLGYWDDCAFSLCSYRRHDQTFYERDSFKRPRMAIDEMATTIRKICDDFETYTVVMDTGGLGKTIAEELKNKYHLPIEPAVKTEKMAHVAMLNGDLHRGAVKIRRSSPLLAEWDKLILTDDGREDPTQPNHLSDAFLYSYRDALQWLERPKQKPKTVSPDEAMLEHRRKIVDDRAKLARKQEMLYGSGDPLGYL